MLLCIDIGNTNTVLATFEGEKLVHSWRIKTDARTTADELGLHVPRAARRRRVADHRRSRPARPCRRRCARCATMLGRYYGDVPTVIVEPGVRTGVQLRHRQPEGGRRRPGGEHAGRVHAATADRPSWSTSARRPTSTWSSARGEFLGGVLAPGIEISVDALAARAAQLRKVELVKPRSVIGKNTVECLQSGVVYGFAGQVDGVVRGDDRGAGRGRRR